MSFLKKLFNSKPESKQDNKRKSNTEINPIVCPYCKAVLEIFPVRKKKCPNCKNLIYPRTLLNSKKKVLMTEEQASDLEKKKRDIAQRNEFKSLLDSFGLSEKEFTQAKTALENELHQPTSTYDVIWKLANAKLLSLMKRSEYQELSMMYWRMAYYAYEEDKSFIHLQQEANKCKLLEYRRRKIISKVTILTAGKGNACEQCIKLEGKVYTIEKALKEMPIPHKNCTFGPNNNKVGWCRCSYNAIIDY